MEIKDFIKESLLQIVEGIVDADNALASKGARIPTKNIKGNGGYYDSGAIDAIQDVEHYLRIDFDIAVVVNESNDMTVGGEVGMKGSSLKIAKFINLDVNSEAGVDASYKHGKMLQTVHRIKCSIPLALPQK